MKRSAVKPLRFAALAAGALMAAGSANAALPSDYEQREYIQGNATSSTDTSNRGYVLTDIFPDPSQDTIDAKFTIGTGIWAKQMWCARGNGAGVSTWSLLYQNTKKFRFDYYNAYNVNSGNTYDPEEYVSIQVVGNVCTLTKGNGTSESLQYNTSQPSFTETGGPLLFFAFGNYNNGSYTIQTSNNNNSKLYSFTITRGGVIIHDLVPAVRVSDSKPGLYDVAAGTFYPGKGSFTMGDVVTVSDSLEITASIDGISSPSPSYGVTNGLAASDSFIVSCGTTPVTNADNTVEYVCTGWKLYDIDNNVVSTGYEPSFTYTHPNPAANRRLEWQWEVSACRGTISAGHGGAVSQTGIGWYAAGTPITVTATPNAGNGFQRWAGTLPEGISATSVSVTFTPTAPFSMAAVFETIGNGGFVFFDVKPNSYWHTATNSTLALPIAFPDGASSATLSVTAPGYSAQYAIPAGTEQYTLSLPAATSPTAENVYDLSLAFNDSAHTVRTAKLGLVYGYNATTTGWTRCIAPAGARAWSKAKGVAVIPIPYNTTSFTIALNGGTATETDTGIDGAAGWYPLRLRGAATAELAAETSEGDFVANLMGDGAGFFLIFR